MKFVILISVFLFGLSSVAAPQIQKVINVDNEIKLIQEKTIAGKGKFKVIEVSNNSVFKDLGYKKGDIINKISGQPIFNPNQLKSALDEEAMEWENTVFDSDFSEGEVNLDNKTFEELEKEF